MRPAHQIPWFGDAPKAAATVRVGAGDYQLAEAARPEGLRLWPAAVLLARHVAAWDCWHGRAVCELGAGLGLPGRVAARAGGQVTFVERDATVAARLRSTLAAEAIPGHVWQVDWRCLHGRWDVVLASDVIYTAYGVAELAAVLARIWSGRGPALLANAGRRWARDFAAALRGHGLAARCRPLRGTHAAEERPCLVDLWSIQSWRP